MFMKFFARIRPAAIKPKKVDSHQEIVSLAEGYLPEPFSVQINPNTGAPETRFEAWSRYFMERPNGQKLNDACKLVVESRTSEEERYYVNEWRNVAQKTLRTRQRAAYAILCSTTASQKKTFMTQILSTLTDAAEKMVNPSESANLTRFACVIALGNKKIDEGTKQSLIKVHGQCTTRDIFRGQIKGIKPSTSGSPCAHP